MNERLNQHQTHEKLSLDHLSKEKLKTAQDQAEKAGHHHQDNVEAIKAAIDKHAISGREYHHSEHDATPSSHSFGTHKALKLQSYKRTLSHIQSRLKGPEKGFSKVIHTPKVDKISEVGAQTIARPIGLLTAGLFAFTGSLVILLMARHYGFRYNFTVFLVLFAGGYLIGSVLELIVKLFKRRFR